MMDMDIQLIQFLIILSLMIISFIFELVPMEVTALGTLGLLLCFNIINIDEAISGFSNKAVVTIGCIFIISKALVKTGFIEVFADFLYKLAGNRKWISFIVFFITTSFISGFINNTAAVAIFIPLAINLCQKYHISPTKILLPLSYAAIFGGTLTLIGTSTNLIISDFIEGLLSLKSIPEKNYFIIHTIFIWLMYIGMFYVIKWSFNETHDLTFLQILPAFIAGSLTITTTNGGIGIFPLAVTIMLSAFGISKETGLAFGWILWSAQTIIIVVLGGLSFFILPLINSFNSK